MFKIRSCPKCGNKSMPDRIYLKNTIYKCVDPKCAHEVEVRND